jgi:hypothetical protein
LDRRAGLTADEYYGLMQITLTVLATVALILVFVYLIYEKS